MADHFATIHWERGTQPFLDKQYTRRHELRFDGGAIVAGSSSPHNVKVPFSDPEAVDPEETFVASLSSCHMLWFLDFACRAGLVVDDYQDEAVGVMARDAGGKQAMTVVTLRPVVRFNGRIPDAAEHARLHHEAHEACFIANSVKTEVRCEPRIMAG